MYVKEKFSLLSKVYYILRLHSPLFHNKNTGNKNNERLYPFIKTYTLYTVLMGKYSLETTPIPAH